MNKNPRITSNDLLVREKIHSKLCRTTNKLGRIKNVIRKAVFAYLPIFLMHLKVVRSINHAQPHKIRCKRWNS